MISTFTRAVCNIWVPITCGMCSQVVSERMPICAACAATIDPIATIDMPVTRTRSLPVAAAAAYDGPIARHIMAKHRADPVSAEELGWLVAQRCVGLLRHVDAVVPVPLHWRRYTQRGFNQAHVIAQRVAREYHIPCVQALSRTVWHGSQANRTSEQRHENVRDVFVVTSSIAQVRGLQIAVIDDVMTSGATLREATRTLERASCCVAANVVAARVV